MNAQHTKPPPKQWLQAVADEYEERSLAAARTRVSLIQAARDAKASGMTLQAIGDVLGLSRQRVKQLLDR